MSIPLPRCAHELSPLEPDEKPKSTPRYTKTMQICKQHNISMNLIISRMNADTNKIRLMPKRISELSPLKSSDDESDKNDDGWYVFVIYIATHNG